MTGIPRFIRFNVVGVLGIGVQLATVALLVRGAGAGAMAATAAGVSAAVVHNFVWHMRWTWRDRGDPEGAWFAAFVRFAGANGLVSLTGSLAMMPVLTTTAGVPVIPANMAAIAMCGLLNYWLSGRFCFPDRRLSPFRPA